MKIPKVFVVVCCALPWIAAFFGAAWLVVLRFPPSGIFHVATVLDGKSAWIFPFLPGERVSSPGVQPDGWVGQRILSDPTYFTSRVPGPYDTVDVALEFRSLRQPLVELGMIHDAAGKELELRPLYASELDSPDWRPASSKGSRGFVRDGVPSERLANPDSRGLAVWDASSTMPLMQDPPGAETSVDVSLRGALDVYLVPTDRISITFTLQPVNRNKGNDIVSFRVFRGDEEVHREAFDVSGSRDNRMGQKLEHAVTLPDVTPGVYRVSFVADDDVFIRHIRTASRRMVVGPRVVFGDVSGYAATTSSVRVYTNSRHLVAETFHKEGLQIVQLGGTKVALKKTHQSVRIDRDDELSGPVELTAPQGDVRIIGDGYFAFTQSAFFEPKPRRFTSSTILKKERIDALITTYSRPHDLGDGWFRSTSSFAVNPSLDRLRFVLSAPGALSRSAAVDVRKIELTYHRNAGTLSDWLHVLRQELANAWRRL